MLVARLAVYRRLHKWLAQPCRRSFCLIWLLLSRTQLFGFAVALTRLFATAWSPSASPSAARPGRLDFAFATSACLSLVTTAAGVATGLRARFGVIAVSLAACNMVAAAASARGARDGLGFAVAVPSLSLLVWPRVVAVGVPPARFGTRRAWLLAIATIARSALLVITLPRQPRLRSDFAFATSACLSLVTTAAGVATGIRARFGVIAVSLAACNMGAAAASAHGARGGLGFAVAPRTEHATGLASPLQYRRSLCSYGHV